MARNPKPASGRESPPTKVEKVKKNVYNRKHVLLLYALCFASAVTAQTRWWKVYGGADEDVGCEVQQTTDGGYVVAGFTYSFGVGGDFYLIKTDASGDTLWTKTYGGQFDDEGYSVRQTADGGYIMTGYTYLSHSSGDEHVCAIKTDSEGDTLWTKVYGESVYGVGASVQQTIDGGYIITGSTSTFPGQYTDVCLVKTNTSGSGIWTGTYGGTGLDGGYSVQQTTDGGYIVAGLTTSFGAGARDVYLIKTDASGDTLWTREYGGKNDDVGFSVCQTGDGGYIIAGYTTSFGAGNADVYLIRTNAQGDTLWTRTFGGGLDD